MANFIGVLRIEVCIQQTCKRKRSGIKSLLSFTEWSVWDMLGDECFADIISIIVYSNLGN